MNLRDKIESNNSDNQLTNPDGCLSHNPPSFDIQAAPVQTSSGDKIQAGKGGSENKFHINSAVYTKELVNSLHACSSKEEVKKMLFKYWMAHNNDRMPDAKPESGKEPGYLREKFGEMAISPPEEVVASGSLLVTGTILHKDQAYTGEFSNVLLDMVIYDDSKPLEENRKWWNTLKTWGFVYSSANSKGLSGDTSGDAAGVLGTRDISMLMNMMSMMKPSSPTGLKIPKGLRGEKWAEGLQKIASGAKKVKKGKAGLEKLVGPDDVSDVMEKPTVEFDTFYVVSGSKLGATTSRGPIPSRRAAEITAEKMEKEGFSTEIKLDHVQERGGNR